MIYAWVDALIFAFWGLVALAIGYVIIGVIYKVVWALGYITLGVAWALLDGLLVTPISRMANNVVDRLWAIDHKAPVGSEPAPHTKDAQ